MKQIQTNQVKKSLTHKSSALLCRQQSHNLEKEKKLFMHSVLLLDSPQCVTHTEPFDVVVVVLVFYIYKKQIAQLANGIVDDLTK